MSIKVLYNIRNNQNYKKGGSVGAGGLDLTKNHLKMKKKTKKKKKREKKNLCSEQDLNPRPSDYKSCT